MSSEPDPAPLQIVLAGHRRLSAVLLALLVLLAWAWLLSGAGMGAMVSFALWPQPAPHDAMPGMAMGGMAMAGNSTSWSAAQFGMTLAMWWVMMAAMMLPSAAPTILLFARVASRGPTGRRPPTEAFLAGYLIIWGLFSFAATLLQWQFTHLELMAPMAMASTNRWLSAGLLLLAGAYQLTPLKDACLSNCRHPAQFLSQHYRPGWRGALRMGVLHGAYCVGCCWLLMALLFVGGVMNIVWIAFLAVLVGLEKLMPHGRRVAASVGVLMVLSAGVILMR